MHNTYTFAESHLIIEKSGHFLKCLLFVLCHFEPLPDIPVKVGYSQYVLLYNSARSPTSWIPALACLRRDVILPQTTILLPTHAENTNYPFINKVARL